MCSQSGIEALIGRLATALLNWGAGVLDKPLHTEIETESPFDGADDLWPEDPIIAETHSEPELILTHQWGLQLPSGDIAWLDWQGTQFANPLDRLMMVAKLKKTALEIGYAEDQIGEFVNRYSWVTRNQLATVVYEDTGAYSLTDPEVAASLDMGKNDNESKNVSQRRDPTGPGPDSGVYPGSMGGDAP